MTWRATTHLAAASLTFVLCGAPRAEFVVEVDAQGTLEGAVVTATSSSDTASGPTPPDEVHMVQSNRQFDPFILPVPVGVPVQFPNRDDTAHHVYSFSPIGTFELPLYKGASPRAMVFEVPGVVPLGCNIHDWMIGYLYVVDTRWYTRLEGNRARFPDLPTGNWQIRIWHPAIDHLPTPAWQVTVTDAHGRQTLSLDFPFASVTQPEPPRDRFDESWDY